MATSSNTKSTPQQAHETNDSQERQGRPRIRFSIDDCIKTCEQRSSSMPCNLRATLQLKDDGEKKKREQPEVESTPMLGKYARTIEESTPLPIMMGGGSVTMGPPAV